MSYQKRLNPYNRNRATTSISFARISKWAFAIGGGVLIIVIALLLPIWHIQAIEVSGTMAPGISLHTVLGTYFSEHTGLLTSEQNIIMLNKSDLTSTLKKTYSTDKISISRNLPHTLLITMSDTGANAIFVTRGTSYAIDQLGKIIGPLGTEAPNALRIYDSGATLPAVGAEVVHPEFMQFLGNVSGHEAFRGYRIKYALLPSSSDASSVTLALDKGFRIMIDPTADLTEQLTRMNRIIAQVVTPGKLHTLDYIDLRFKEKVFYKTK